MSQDQIPHPKRIWSRPWFIVLCVLVLIVALFLLFRLSQKFALDKKLDEIRAAGYPATCKELNEWYSIPKDVNNAADTILDALALFNQWPGEDVEYLPFFGALALPLKHTEPMTESVETVAAEYLADNKKALELFHKAAQIEHCRYPIDYSVADGMKIRYMNDLRESAQLLGLEAYLHIQNKQPDLVIDSINAAFGLARSLEKEPILIAQLIRIALQAIALKSLERSVNQIEFSDEQLERMSRMVQEAHNPDGMLYGFVGWRCEGVEIISRPINQNLKWFQPGTAPSRPAIFLYSFFRLNDQFASIHLDFITRYIEACKLPTHERLQVAKTIDADMDKIPKYHILAEIMNIHGGGLIKGDCRIIAMLENARAALAVERFRLANARFPESLNDLVPKFIESVPIDPFDGKKVRYKKTYIGFVVYSVGDNLKDDGAKEKSRQNRDTWDIPFFVER